MTFLQIAGIALGAACFTAAALGLVAWLFLPRSAFRAPSSTVFVRTWKPGTPEQWAKAFRDWPESDPRWRALWDLLAHHLEAELGLAERVGSDPHAIAQWAGRLQTLLFLRAQILNLRRPA